ncbi:hypothetical protein ACFPM1_15205 [Halorubrum rubrum]|uniref:Uncharacterized protein n=1 Tax=Halorubrum rubrum TaxID=1126240 RepID=A0ABD5R5Q5_9EURY|nr:hypothetical protein [Halorubrum rubrum]
MFALAGDRRLTLAMLGGVLIPLVLGLNEAAQEYIGLAVVVPMLLGFGLIEIYRSYGDTYGNSGRAGVLLTAAGISLLGLVVLAYALLPPMFALLYILAVPFVAGSVSLALGSGLLALGLRKAGLISRPAVAGLGLGVIPILGAMFSASFGSGTPSAIWAVLIGIPYGFGWVLTAHELRTAHRGRVPQSPQISVGRTVIPHVVGAGLVGAILVLLSAGRFLPLGALSTTPWVGESFALDILHLGVGLLGLVVAVSGRPEKVRTYDQIVGIGALCLVGITLFGTFVSVPGIHRLAAELGLILTDTILYVPIGIILTTLGFGVAVEDS